MTITVPLAARPLIRSAVDTRPPFLTWLRPTPPIPSQPTLDFTPPQLADPGSVGPVPEPGWMAAPDPLLPNATSWSTSLAQALVETLLGRRAPAQLSRWVDAPVLSAITTYRRRRVLAGRSEVGRPTLGPEMQPTTVVLVHSVRVQHPTSQVAEVSAHLKRGRRSLAIAFRLEAQHGRWLCTALEVGPRLDS